jgi:hypothetical protein
VCFAVALLLNAIQTNKLYKRFDKFVEKHNGLCDTSADMYDEIIDEFNERIDDINNEFHNIYQILQQEKEFADDLTDTMEVMCDTDEAILDKLYDMEEDLTVANVILDDIVSELFVEQPEEVEEKPAKKAKKTKKTK